MFGYWQDIVGEKQRNCEQTSENDRPALGLDVDMTEELRQEGVK